MSLSGVVALIVDVVDVSAAFASCVFTPNNKIAPTRIEAVPTVNLRIEYLFFLSGWKDALFLDVCSSFNLDTP